MNSLESTSTSNQEQPVLFLDEIARGYVTVSENVLTLFLDETPLNDNDKLAYVSYFLDYGFIKDQDSFNRFSLLRKSIIDKIESERILTLPGKINKITSTILRSIKKLI